MTSMAIIVFVGVLLGIAVLACGRRIPRALRVLIWPAESHEQRDPDDLVVVATAPTGSEADILRSKLEACGIRAFTPEDSWISTSGRAFPEILVKVRDVDRARSILADGSS